MGRSGIDNIALAGFGIDDGNNGGHKDVARQPLLEDSVHAKNDIRWTRRLTGEFREGEFEQ